MVSRRKTSGCKKERVSCETERFSCEMERVSCEMERVLCETERFGPQGGTEMARKKSLNPSWDKDIGLSMEKIRIGTAILQSGTIWPAWMAQNQ